MKIFKDNIEYQGDAEELARYFALMDTPPPTTEDFNEDDFKPLIDESADLRTKLAQDPSFNPYGGVIPSKENPDAEKTPTVSADLDTGVDLVN